MLIAVALASSAQEGSTFVRGIVRDSVTTQGLPYASVTVHPSGVTTVADSRGLFELLIPEGSLYITGACQGYGPASVPVKRSSHNLYDINLVPKATELKELTVKKKKYSKRNNPAVEFARRIRKMAETTDPTRNSDYSFDRYERISVGVHNFDTTARSGIMKRMPFLIEHVDTSEISGLPVLNISVKERAGSDYYRKGKFRKVVTGLRSHGVDEFVDQQNMQTVLDDLLREIDLYQPDITLLRNTFVSPLSPLAADFYRFYLVDSAAVVSGSDKPHIVLAFYPRNKASFGFSGHLYVLANDTSMFISRVEMQAPKDINLNFLRDMNIVQSYARASDGSRLKQTDNLILTMQVMPQMPEVYVSRKISYSNHSFGHRADADSLFSNLGTTHTQEEAVARDSMFWNSRRVIPTQAGEDRVELLMERLRSKKLFYWGEKFLKIMVAGYVPTGRDSKFDLGPVNTLASYNSLEGLRLRAGGITTANLSGHWFGRAYVAYGFRDRRWKYYGEAEYSFNRKKYHSREFPVHSLRLSHGYDIDRLGSHYLYTNPDNFVLSLSRRSDRSFSYLRATRLLYTLELANNLSFTAKVERLRQEATPFLPFVTGAGTALSHFNETVFEVGVRYAPGETFYQAKSYRIPVDETVPVFAIRHRFAPRGKLGCAFGVNRTEISISKTTRFPVVGALALSVNGGHVWGSSPFTELFIPNANLSYTIQPESFALMNPMEFINSSYVAWFATWELRGALFNLVPGLKKAGLREVVSFNGIWGRLDKRNNPAHNRSLLRFPEAAATSSMGAPYMEISAGIDNIFRILRVDYVWRLNYLDVPYDIDRRGLRVALHFTF